jgi:hypothetical protein
VTRKAGASNPQVRERIRPSLQVARSAPRTLSRWRHGFEPRWDYTQRRRSEALSSLSRDSAPPFRPAFVPRPTATRYERPTKGLLLGLTDRETTSPRRRSGGGRLAPNEEVEGARRSRGGPRMSLRPTP